jgi:hypothetical protein
MRRIAVIILSFTLLYLLPIFIVVTISHKTWRLDSDYDSVLPAYTYAIQFIKTNGTFPRTFPYAGTSGLTFRADPSFPFYNPFILIPFLIFDIEHGMWIILFLSVFFSGIIMAKILKLYNLSDAVCLWGGLLYMFSGALAARIASGHVSFIYTYPLWPILFYGILHPSKILHVIVLYALVVSLLTLSGDIYGIFFYCLFYIVGCGYIFLTQKHHRLAIIIQTMGILLGTVCFSCIKIFYIISDRSILSQMTRLYQPVFGQGSLNIILVLIPFIIPWRILFYDRPFFQQHLGLYFNWYEYYAFISPLPFVFILSITKIKKEILYPLLFLLFTGFLFVSQKFFYSPFYWINKVIPFYSVIRVQQRIYVPLTSIAIIFFSLLASQHITFFKKRWITYVVLTGTIMWVFFVNIKTIPFAFEPKRIHEEQLVQKLKILNPGNHYVLNLICCDQTYLIRNRMYVINYYAGWQSRDTPKFYDPMSGVFQPEVLTSIRPLYILSPPSMQFNKYSYYPVIESDIGTIWKTDDETIKPDSINNQEL